MDAATTTSAAARFVPAARSGSTGARRDLVLVLLAGAATYLLASRFEVSEVLRSWFAGGEHYQMDELPLVIVVLVCGLAWYSWRRSVRAAAEMRLRLQAQEALAEERAQFEVLFTESLSAHFIADAEGVIALANPALAGILGLEGPAQAIGRRLADFYEDPAQWPQHREQLASRGRLELSGFNVRRSDGPPVAVIGRLTGRRTAQGQLEVHGFVTDVSALESVRSALARALEENRFLSQRGIQMLEEERRHIARELHDEMGQWLNALKIDAVAIRDRSPLPSDVVATAQAIIDHTNHVYDGVRNLLRRLRPVALDELGLAPAIQYSVEQWRRRHPEVQCTCSLQDLPETLGEAVNITLFRFVQECLTNVTKHARAQRVDIALRYVAEGREVTVRVQDDGRGIDAGEPRMGYGLLGMRERIEMLGGRFWVASEPARGTTVGAMLPATEPEE